MAERFHVETSGLSSGDVVALDREESHHLLKVMRVRPGQAVRVFGAGREYEAVLTGTQDGKAVVELRREIPVLTPPLLRLVFALPWLKGGKTEYMVQKLTELGAGAITGEQGTHRSRG